MADQGNADAQLNLGLMYEYGKGTEEDYTQAVRWYRKAAEQGDTIAQLNLAVMYKYGTGVNEDFSQSVLWYKKSC